MSWIILTVIALILLGIFAGPSSGEHKSDTNDTDGERPPAGDEDQMLEDWYASQELDNDLDDWER